jgi:transposase
MGREREGPKRFLGNFEGILQSDGYGAYDHVGGAGIFHAACWAHARGKFFEAVKLNPKDQTSIRIVAQIDELFAIDVSTRKPRKIISKLTEIAAALAPALENCGKQWTCY